MISDARGFPWPVDEPYKLDPATGYPTPQVNSINHLEPHILSSQCFYVTMECFYMYRTVQSTDGQTTSSLRQQEWLIRAYIITLMVRLFCSLFALL